VPAHGNIVIESHCRDGSEGRNNMPVNVRDGDAVRTLPAGLSLFRIGDDGKLTFVRTYDVDVGDKSMFWMGMVPLPA
jgi:6-phosphogluconolactonase